MTEERTVWLEGKPYIVVLSDEREALLAAQAAGRAVVGVEGGNETDRQFLPVRYVVETPDAADPGYLERVLRRQLKLPWIITGTDRLIIREFTEADAAFVPREAGDGEADRVFYTPELLREYIRCQYGFYECGVWALIDKVDGTLIGKAGITPAKWRSRRAMPDVSLKPAVLELGYHIFEPYRRKGYATEACRGILNMLAEVSVDLFDGRITVLARTDAANTASIRVLESCGFVRDTSAGRLLSGARKIADRKSKDKESLPNMTEKIDFLRDIGYNDIMLKKRGGHYHEGNI